MMLKTFILDVSNVHFDCLVFSELVQTMRVTDKCAVYSFGVVALEVMMGRRPGDLLSSLSSIKPPLSNDPELFLKEVLDLRLEAPTAHHAFCGTKIIIKNSSVPG
jgi:hypothetical protein